MLSDHYGLGPVLSAHALSFHGLQPQCWALNPSKSLPGSECAPELFKRSDGLRGKQTEASMSDLGQRDSVTRGGTLQAPCP